MLQGAQRTSQLLARVSLLASSALAGAPGGAGCCWVRPGRMSLMMAQSSAFYMLPSKDRQAARAQRRSQLLVWVCLLASGALAGAHGGAGSCRCPVSLMPATVPRFSTCCQQGQACPVTVGIPGAAPVASPAGAPGGGARCWVR